MVTSTTIRTTTTTSVWCEPESEAAPLVTFRAVFQAYQACRKRKGKTVQTCLFEQNGLDNLFAITHDLQAQVWRPAPPVVFYVTKPKAREIYAAQFQDRVVHHWLVPRLEALFDNELIYDCAANRKGKGTHFAVERLQRFMRKQGSKHTLAEVTQGADILGYIVRPSYRLVRRRVVGNLYEKLLSLAKALWHPRAGGWHCDLNYPLREQLRATLASYWGHFNHANTRRLKNWFFQRFAWLSALYRCEINLTPRWQPNHVTTFAQQVAYFKRHYMVPCLLLQKGNQVIELHCGAVYPINHINQRLQQAQQQGQAYALVTEQGYLRSGLKRRVLRQLWLPAGIEDDYFSVQPQEEHAYA